MCTKPKKSALITDLDNTLFDWFDIWRSTFIPMLEKTSEITNIPKQKLIKEIKPIHQKHGTAEYAFVLQEMPCLLEMYGTPEAIMKALDSAIHAARSSRLEHLKLYNGVYDTLSELRAKRVKIIAYTESKQWYTQYRLKRFGLDHFIDHVYSPEDHEIKAIREDERTAFQFDHTKFSHTPKGEVKPNPSLLTRIIKEQSLDKDDCVYIGDSELKDIAMAKNAGVTSVFAKYGTGHFDDDRIAHYELLREVTHWTEEEVKREAELKASDEHHEANYSINNFSELLEIIDFQRK
ncbi:HAD family hydrolase [Vibrio splendidus]|uniref:HAD family hydrolase n=1 Tax=Vibrio splendidus TaxID=29497 RepID=UPI001E378C5A|nr:HAD-IA family hydrolase [Vibrio splendidus]MCC4863321.1 HAD-IA family hydrolase [Vibrio splendidus]